MKKVAKNKTFLFFILGLTILLLLLFSNVVSAGYRTANSALNTEYTWKISDPDFELGGVPKYVRIYLKNPVGETVHKVEYQLREDERVKTWFAEYTVFIHDVGLRVPYFPMVGTWKVEVMVWDYLGPLENQFDGIYSSQYIVGESSLMDNLFAPIYIYNDMFGVFASGDEISIALPGIFFLSMIIWIPAVSIGLLMYIKSSYKIGMHLFKRESGGK